MFSAHTLKVLDFPNLLDIVAEQAHSPPGKEKVSELTPSSQASRIIQGLKEVEEFLLAEEKGEATNLQELEDITPLLEKIRPYGTALSPKELLRIKNLLSLSDRIKKLWSEKKSIYPRIASKISKLHLLEDLKHHLDEILSPYGKVLDGASTLLAELRGEINTTKRTIKDQLQELLQSQELSKAFQEKTISIRNGRYVLPVKSGSSNRIKGLVQDQSATGSTLYIEPFSVVEGNNKLIKLVKQEEKEINRILIECTNRVRNHRGALTDNLQLLSSLDCIGARARFAIKFKGGIPQVTDRKEWHIIEGRHPLLIEQKGIHNTVPLSVNLQKTCQDLTGTEEPCNTLVITGPNTGGKTLALKTMGILALMVQSSIPPTAHRDSVFPVFNGIMADIGDEQSIEQSLSTFSSHVKNIKEILETANSNTLVILDELGAGTDPWEGAPLGMAVLEELHHRRCWCLVSTHHNELKLFAHATPGMKNASVEFDPKSLAPTYKLLVGIPGRSNALIIAEKLGFPTATIQKARDLQKREQGEIENAIQELGEETSKVQKKAEALEKEHQRLLDEIDRLQRERETFLKEQENRATEGRKILSLLHKETKRLSKELKKKRVEDVHNRLRELEKLASTLGEYGEPGEEDEVSPGDRVRVWGLGLEGRVSRLEGDQAEVDTGKMKVLVPKDKLAILENKTQQAQREVTHVKKLESSLCTFHYSGESTTSGEINLLGKRVEEAVSLLDRFLDNAYLTGLKEVRIIHGIGTGTLKKAVVKLLSVSPIVESHREASRDQGGAGATIAKLKRT